MSTWFVIVREFVSDQTHTIQKLVRACDERAAVEYVISKYVGEPIYCGFDVISCTEIL